MNLFDIVIDVLFAAGLFINAALFIPQALRLYRKKESRDLSKITFTGFCLIQLVTVIHGVKTHDWILAIGYILSLLTCGITTALIYWYRR